MPTTNPVLCGSIAGTIGGLGVLMHNRAYRHDGIPCTYVSFQPRDAQSAVEAMRALGIRGLGVSMPYKVEIMEYLDRLDETAREIGAVNTIVNDGGILTGYNTDWAGAMGALGEITEIRGKKAALLGAGGAARAILYGLLREGAQVELYNQSEERGRALGSRFQVPYLGPPSTFQGRYDIIINATSVGYRTQDTLLTAPDFPAGAAVLDVVFQPLETVFLKEAVKAGCKVAPGWEMLILQAIAQDELYLNTRPSYAIMKETLMEKFGK